MNTKPRGKHKREILKFMQHVILKLQEFEKTKTVVTEELIEKVKKIREQAQTYIDSQDRKLIEALRKLKKLFEAFAKKYFTEYVTVPEYQDRLKQYFLTECNPIIEKNNSHKKEKQSKAPQAPKTPTLIWTGWNIKTLDRRAEAMRTLLKNQYKNTAALKAAILAHLDLVDMIPEAKIKPKFTPVNLDFLNDFLEAGVVESKLLKEYTHTRHPAPLQKSDSKVQP